MTRAFLSPKTGRGKSLLYDDRSRIILLYGIQSFMSALSKAAMTFSAQYPNNPQLSPETRCGLFGNCVDF